MVSKRPLGLWRVGFGEGKALPAHPRQPGADRRRQQHRRDPPGLPGAEGQHGRDGRRGQRAGGGGWAGRAGGRDAEATRPARRRSARRWRRVPARSAGRRCAGAAAAPARAGRPNHGGVRGSVDAQPVQLRRRWASRPPGIGAAGFHAPAEDGPFGDARRRRSPRSACGAGRRSAGGRPAGRGWRRRAAASPGSAAGEAGADQARHDARRERGGAGRRRGRAARRSSRCRPAAPPASPAPPSSSSARGSTGQGSATASGSSSAMTEAAGFSPKARVGGRFVPGRARRRGWRCRSARRCRGGASPMHQADGQRTASARAAWRRQLPASARAAPPASSTMPAERQPGGQRAARLGGPGRADRAPQRRARRASATAAPRGQGSARVRADLRHHAQRQRHQPDRRHGLGLQHDGQRRERAARPRSAGQGR